MNAAEALELERMWWALSGVKEEAIRERFGLSPVRYHQKLNAIIETPEALAIDAQTVNRLRRIRGLGWS
ncbi:DUF3263 domain-containing protein [Mycobacteroides abscessus]|uniref:DUF3263 domain-containing protein n=1 Tax=Mycobacteroides abscessus TaxID=36809 RepID=UPI000925C5B8|nr:DUF3263 domain-containing protein [Mycobacteroides abscessus]QOF29651.1 hypothetical protein E3G43_003211 [Mycobacteroides abscessus]SII18921.1 Fis family transcriptional regulator [Mycobacteroides abscessus subsp. abscessus]SII32170.1 Fis family transcriptional regulator [Mycobacteroides abscessus subsp. abscessus]SII64027.1 Fis family transcriptional regulator [Mycobacteroides abscessus subsp. abscessus]SIJ97853.1 Fis family transcriptional regulator [Mycobacteroides abscessus subsp. absc